MFKIISYILIGFILIFSSPAWAENTDHNELEISLLELINTARANPLATAASFGMNPEQILADLPELHDVLVSGLPPLEFNAKLQKAAKSHTEDMLNRDYYNQISPEGITHEDRIDKSGYIAELKGETLGILGFVNFVSPDDAVSRIFENMLKDELNPARIEKRNILSSEMEDVGIGARAGRVTVGGTRCNAYIAVCDFGAKLDADYYNGLGKLLLLDLINQLRKSPLKVLADSGFDIEQLVLDLPEMKDVFDNGLPALKFNSSLSNAAEMQLIKNFENKSSELNNDDLYDRILDSCYAPKIYGEAVVILNYSQKIDIESVIKEFFSKMLISELNADNTEKYILNPVYEDIGISLISDEFQKDGNVANVLICIFAEDAVSEEEWELFGLINKARKDPLGMANEMGIESEYVLVSLPAYNDVLINGLPPLAFNPRLYFSAREHAVDMLFNGYIDSVAKDGRTLYDRIIEKGYIEPLVYGESQEILSLCRKDDVKMVDGVKMLFEQMFLKELSIEYSDKRNILNIAFKEAGMSYMTGISTGLGNICGDYIHMINADFGTMKNSP